VTEQPDHHTSADFEFVGGALALDFVNTGSARLEGPFKERLAEYGDLVRFARDAEELDASGALVLGSLAAADPQKADEVLSDGRALREAIYRVFSARSRGESISAADLELISRRNAEAVAHRRLSADSNGCQFVWPDPPAALDQVLWPVAVDATELLVSDDVT